MLDVWDLGALVTVALTGRAWLWPLTIWIMSQIGDRWSRRDVQFLAGLGLISALVALWRAWPVLLLVYLIPIFHRMMVKMAISLASRGQVRVDGSYAIISCYQGGHEHVVYVPYSTLDRIKTVGDRVWLERLDSFVELHLLPGVSFPFTGRQLGGKLIYSCRGAVSVTLGPDETVSEARISGKYAPVKDHL